MNIDYSDVSTLRQPIHVSDIGREVIGLQNICGSDNIKRGNLHFIEDNVIIYVSGNAVVIENIIGGNNKSYLMGLNEGSVGCVAVHPSKKYFAVGGLGHQARIHVYSYPSLNVVKILSGGAEKGYATMAFNRTGQSLASVAIAPDYMLTIWDWEEEKMGLHSKAFGQDVYNIKFSLDDDFRLTTSGTGHIRFWKIASTFTGMKLQGSIGKFGKVELSDISSFCDLPDGKVISGTEFGSLLLWEGNFIKCRFILSDGSSCHDSEITSVEFDRNEKCIVTTSMDGFIKWWDFTVIDSAEIDSDVSMDFVLKPLAQISIGNGDGIQTLLDSGYQNNTRLFVYKTDQGTINSCKFDLRSKGSDIRSSLLNVVQTLTAETGEDENIDPIASPQGGQVMYYPDPVQTTIVSGHVGSVTGVDTCPCGPYAASCDDHGNVILWDFRKKKEIFRRSFTNESATCLTWLPMECSGSAVGSSFAVGFKNGIVRVLTISQSATKGVIITLSLMLKPHDAAVTCINFSSKGNYVTTSAMDGTIFFFNCSQVKSVINWAPIRFISLPNLVSAAMSAIEKRYVYCISLHWSSDDSSILCSCHDAMLREINVKDILAMDPQCVETYEATASIKEIVLKIQDPGIMSGAKDLANAASTQPLNEDVGTPGKIGGSSSHQNSQHSSTMSRRGSVDRGSRSSVASVEAVAVIPTIALSTSIAMYTTGRRAGGILTSSYTKSEIRAHLMCEASVTFKDALAHDIPMGLYTIDGKEYSKTPTVTCMKYGWSGKLIVHGALDGSINIRPVSTLETFARTSTHSNLGVVAVALSFDDRYIISGGKDGIIAIQRVRTDILFGDAPLNLAKDIEAGTYQNHEHNAKHPRLVSPSYVEPAFLRLVRSEESLDDQFPAFHKESERLIEKLILGLTSTDIASEADPSKKTYSIQEDRLRQGEDVRLSAAETVKEQTREKVADLRRRFDFLRRQNDLLPEAVRIPREKLMEVDGDYWEILLQQREGMIEEIHRQYAYETERSLALKNKIKGTFMNGIIIEEMKLVSFPSSDPDARNKFSGSLLPFVLSLRTQALNDNVVEILDNLRQHGLHPDQLESTSIELEHGDVYDDLSSIATTSQRGGTADISSSPLKATGVAADGGMNGQTNSQAGMLRRELRKQRLENLKLQESKKPKDDEDDIRDIEAIKTAEKTLGNYKLKNSNDYEITEENRVNAPKKRIEMALLEEKMVIMRLKFNEKFLNLRQQKYDMVNEIQGFNKRIREINDILQEDSLSSSLLDHQHDSLEFPDDRDEVTLEELNTYRKLRGLDKNSKGELVPWEKIVPPPHSVITGKKTVIPKDEDGAYILSRKLVQPINIESFRSIEMNLALSTSAVSNQPTIPSTKADIKPPYECDDRVFKTFYKSSSTTQVERENLAKLEDILPHLRFLKEAKKAHLQYHDLSTTAASILMEKKKEMGYERDSLMQLITNKINSFNHSIRELIVERHQLIFELKQLELRLLVFYQEYQILLTFEDRDLALQQRQQRCQGEQDEVTSTMNELKMKLDMKMEEVGSWQVKLASLQAELRNTVPDNHAHHEILVKIFKKKVKRTAKASMNNSYMGDDGNDDDEYLEEEEEDDDDDDDYDEVEDVCPIGCEAVLYERIINLREKRVHIDDNINDINKIIDDQKKTFERCKQREKQIVKDVHQTEVEVRQFHLQKQAALNQIKVVAPLKLSQIYAFQGSGVFTKPSDSLMPAAVQPSSSSSAAAVVPMSANARNSVVIDTAPVSPVDDNETISMKMTLKNPHERELVESVNADTHVLFKKETLLKLDERILKLHQECDQAMINLKELHRERIRLKRDKDTKEEEIKQQEAKCTELQMLKFGRIVQLDDLEAGADRSKEEEAEEEIKALEKTHRVEHARLMAEVEAIQEELAQATIKNTEYLEQVASLTEEKLKLSRDLNETSTSIAKEILPSENSADRQEHSRLTSYIKAQAKEIESLRSEITILKRKDIPPVTLSASIPLPSKSGGMIASSSDMEKEPESIYLPPIRDAQP